MVAEQTEKDINITRLQYVPVAVRSQILYFCVSDLCNVDPMYQYSLEWFLSIFLMGISNSERAGACPKQPLLSSSSPRVPGLAAAEARTPAEPRQMWPLALALSVVQSCP